MGDSSGDGERRKSLWRSREGRRRLRLGLATLFGVRPSGFFIPYRHADAFASPGTRNDGPMGLLLAKRQPTFRSLIRLVDRYGADLMAIGHEPPPAPRWTQDWFPRLDAAVAYALIRRLRPKRIVEVGAGHSTRFFARAVADQGCPTRIVAIDPDPRANLSGLKVELRRMTLQAAGETAFTGLAAGDIASIDSSHILMPGTDVDILINRVLPRLPAGVLVQIHDIFLPDDYPAQWSWRAYNEQLGVAPLLQGGGWRILWSSRYVATRLADRLDGTVLARLPLPPGAFESSLWLKRTAA
jgi:hypothetical protein